MGSTNNTVSALHSFFLAMVLNPDVQRRAQDEIDKIVGKDRLPTLADRGRLPYVEAVLKEVYRINPVAPLGVAHASSQSDVYQGYVIPKGTVIMPNIWSMMRDSDVYANPMEFNPLRFLPTGDTPPEKDPKELCFGFGRRICPGLNLADASIFIACAMTLATFDISKRVENGEVVEPLNEYTGGSISHPKPFRCSIRPRSSRTKNLINITTTHATE